MKNSVFFNFLFLLLIKHQSKHLAIFIISIFIVFLISSVLFIKNSLQKEIFSTLENQSDFIIQQTNGSKIVNTPVSWIDDFSSINGVKNTQQRVYGQYYFLPENVYFTIVGIDLFEENTNKKLNELLKSLDISNFLENDSMIIGNGIKKIFETNCQFDVF